MKAAAYVLVLLVVVALSVQGYAQTPDDKLIVPGQRIGKWTLDMTIDDLVRMNGAPNANGSFGQHLPVMPARPTINYDYVDNVYSHAWHNLSLYVGTVGENSQKVLFLAIFSGDYKTAEGLSFNTNPQGVEALIGKPTANVLVASGTRMIYDQRGLAVFISRNEVYVLIVFRPGTAKQIWNFQAGSTPGPDVAQIFGDLLTR